MRVRLGAAFTFSNAVVLSGLAALPTSVEGYVYYQSGRALARTDYQLGIMLESGGTFRCLYQAGMAPSGTAYGNVSGEDGTWSYRRIDEKNAEIVLTTRSGSNPMAGARTLRFESHTSGVVAPQSLPIAVSSGSFRLVPSTDRAPLVNCANRSFVRAGSSASTAFVISGTTSRAVLIRAVGPTLAQFGITGALLDPTLSISRDERVVAQNDDWDIEGSRAAGESIRRTNQIVSAFSLPSGSKDAAVVVELVPGTYVAEVTAAPGQAGKVLVEVYVLP